jgi:cell division protein FtsL
VEGQGIARFHRESDHRRLRAMAGGLLGAALLVVLVVGVVELRIQQVRLSYRLDGLRANLVQLEEDRGQLRVELDSLRSLARIEGKARTELGMAPPTRDQIQLAREFMPGRGGTAASAMAAGEAIAREAKRR